VLAEFNRENSNELQNKTAATTLNSFLKQSVQEK